MLQSMAPPGVCKCVPSHHEWAPSCCVKPYMDICSFSCLAKLELIELDFANQTPFIKNIQIADPTTPTDDNSPLGPSPKSSILVINLDVGLVSPDSRIVLKARLGGRRFGKSLCMGWVRGEGRR